MSANKPKKGNRRNYYRNSPARLRDQRHARVRFALRLGGYLVSVALMSLTFLLGHAYLTQCDYFKARKVTVTGGERLSRVEIMAKAEVTDGMNVLDANLGKIRKRLLDHPWIAEAEVRRELPDLLFIHIRENAPLAILDLGRKFLLNTEGSIFKELEKNDPAGLPMISGLEFCDIHVKDHPGSTSFRAVMDVLNLGRQPGIILPNTCIQKVEVDREIGLTLFTANQAGGVIELGYENYLTKYDRLREIIGFMEHAEPYENVATVDLKNMHRVVIRPCQMGPGGKNQKEV